ncbi:MAG: flagellin [Symbiobacterium sp.]|uniref:flagellin N-terminal helical domain-containing protein n=1 Tax=Symbiobacterium sp. TaxID=1971213 RepID=UPI003464A845
MRINTNMAALNAWRALTVNNEAMTKSLEKLSSGYRVNRAADDAAGLAVSEKMRAQIRGLNMAVRNAQDGISMIQTAEGGATQIQNMVQRMRELAVQAANGTLTPEDRGQLQKEFAQLQEEVSRTAVTTTFNEQRLLNRAAFVTASDDVKGRHLAITLDQTKEYADGEYTVVYLGTDAGGNHQFQIEDADGNVVQGAIFDASNFDATDLNAGDEVGSITITVAGTRMIELQAGVGAGGHDKLTVNMEALDATALGIDVLSIDTAENARSAITSLDKALETISGARATLGSYQNRLESAIQTLRIQSENLTAAESRIRDVDMAQEMATFTKYQILQQASTAMLAQANMSTQSILSLLR